MHGNEIHQNQDGEEGERDKMGKTEVDTGSFNSTFSVSF